jgi:hypothetical protein
MPPPCSPHSGLSISHSLRSLKIRGNAICESRGLRLYGRARGADHEHTALLLVRVDCSIRILLAVEPRQFYSFAATTDKHGTKLHAVSTTWPRTRRLARRRPPGTKEARRPETDAPCRCRLQPRDRFDPAWQDTERGRVCCKLRSRWTFWRRSVRYERLARRVAGGQPVQLG